MRVRTSRGEISVESSGNGGRAVVLLHPLALSGAFWAPLLDNLDGCRVLAFDARGHGKSLWDREPFTIGDIAEDVAAALDELAIAGASVAGMSMGGCVAIELAARRPDLVSRLALADTTPDYGPDRVERWRERAVQAVTVPRAKQLDFQVNRWFGEDFAAANPAVVALVTDIFLATDSRVHAQACRALGEFDGSPLLSKISAPTLVTVGAEDYATPVASAEKIAAGIADAALAVTPGARHLSLLESPDAWGLVTSHLIS